MLDFHMNTSSPSLYGQTLVLIQETERQVLTFRSAGAIPDAIMRNVMFPIPFLQLGIAELFRPASKWALTTILSLIVAAVLISNLGVTTETKSFIFLACTYLPLFLVIFAVPSTFAFDSIKETQIKSLADYIYSLGINDEDKIEALEENISNIAARTYARMRTLQWLIAALWAFFLYAMNQLNNISLKIAPEQISKVVSDNINAFFIYGLVSLLSLLVILSYKKGNDAVFRRLQFAIQELKFRVASN